MHLPSGYVTCCDSPFSHVYERRAGVYISRCHVIITRSNHRYPIIQRVARTCVESKWSLACGFKIAVVSSPFWLPGSISLLSSHARIQVFFLGDRKPPLRLSAIFFCLLICPGPCNNLDPLLKFLYEPPPPPSDVRNPPSESWIRAC